MAEKACDRDRQAPEPKLPAIILPAYNFFFRGGYHSSFSIFEDAVHLLLHMFRRGNGNGEWKGQAVMEIQINIHCRVYGFKPSFVLIPIQV